MLEERSGDVVVTCDHTEANAYFARDMADYLSKHWPPEIAKTEVIKIVIEYVRGSHMEFCATFAPLN